MLEESNEASILSRSLSMNVDSLSSRSSLSPLPCGKGRVLTVPLVRRQHVAEATPRSSDSFQDGEPRGKSDGRIVEDIRCLRWDSHFWFALGGTKARRQGVRRIFNGVTYGVQ